MDVLRCSELPLRSHCIFDTDLAGPFERCFSVSRTLRAPRRTCRSSRPLTASLAAASSALCFHPRRLTGLLHRAGSLTPAKQGHIQRSSGRLRNILVAVTIQADPGWTTAASRRNWGLALYGLSEHAVGRCGTTRSCPTASYGVLHDIEHECNLTAISPRYGASCAIRGRERRAHAPWGKGRARVARM
jgi:hypothetical protein